MRKQKDGAGLGADATINHHQVADTEQFSAAHRQISDARIRDARCRRCKRRIWAERSIARAAGAVCHRRLRAEVAA
jgi:hypothetical protein